MLNRWNFLKTGFYEGIKDRLRRAQQHMQDQGFDAYLILTHDDYIYFFGEDRFQPRAIIPAMGPPLVVTFVGEEDEVKESLGIEDVRIFGTVGQQIKDVVGVMRQMAGDKESMKVGVQMWFSTPAFLLDLFQRANPKVQVADIAAVRMETATKWLKPGITENEVGASPEDSCR